MWFRNLQLFRFNKPFNTKPETLATKLANKPFVPCGKLDLQTTGFVPPLGRHSQMLVHAANGYRLLTTRTEQKILPASVVREMVGERVQAQETREMRKLGKKDKERVREQILHELLPRALVRSSFTSAYIDAAGEWLIVDSASRKRAENFCTVLRDAVGSLDVAPLRVTKAPAHVMTQWIKHARMPKGFVLGDTCEMREPQADGAVVRCRRMDLTSDIIHKHLEEGKHVTQLALSWQDRLEFILNDELAIKRLRMTDVLEEQLEAVDTDDEAARFDANFSLMVLEIARLLPDVLKALGGADTN
jgi:recombination associated protein RdgC